MKANPKLGAYFDGEQDAKQKVQSSGSQHWTSQPQNAQFLLSFYFGRFLCYSGLRKSEEKHREVRKSQQSVSEPQEE